MSGTYVQWASSDALIRRLRDMAAYARPGSRAVARARADILDIVKTDHTDKMLRGVDRYGQPRAPLAASTIKKGRRGNGPSLIPRGRQSRFIRNFKAEWEQHGGDYVLFARFTGMVGKNGVPWSVYHLTGASKPGTNWVLPRRDVSGITPRGWSQIKERQQTLAQNILRYGGSKS
jgi:hypothetical protein